MKKNLLKEILIADTIMSIISKEVEKMATTPNPDVSKLERIAKCYSTLMASNRENIKHGLYSKLGDEEFTDSGDDADEAEESGDEEL